MKRRWFLIGGMFGFGLLWNYKFNRIVIHHSAADHGDLALLRRVHAERQKKDPIPFASYHFVIGNGRGMKDGEVQSTRRWTTRLWGAHLSAKNPVMNLRSIGICLIGNFENYPPTIAQLDSLTDLVRKLRSRRFISLENITGHGQTFGQSTVCPGRQFDVEAWKKRLT